MENVSEIFDGVIDMASGVIDIRIGGPAGARDEALERRTLAALCLDGQPFGFTHADGKLLRTIASAMGLYGDEDEQRVRNLADRIEALLPPA